MRRHHEQFKLMLSNKKVINHKSSREMAATVPIACVGALAAVFFTSYTRE
jgi:hypothetical protein